MNFDPGFDGLHLMLFFIIVMCCVVMWHMRQDLRNARDPRPPYEAPEPEFDVNEFYDQFFKDIQS